MVWKTSEQKDGEKALQQAQGKGGMRMSRVARWKGHGFWRHNGLDSKLILLLVTKQL